MKTVLEALQAANPSTVSFHTLPQGAVFRYQSEVLLKVGFNPGKDVKTAEFEFVWPAYISSVAAVYLTGPNQGVVVGVRPHEEVVPL